MIDVNDDGLAVGCGTVASEPDRSYTSSRFKAPGGARAEIVTPAGRTVSLEPILVPGVDSVAFGVNRSGRVVGEIYHWRLLGGYERLTRNPFVWSEAEGVRYPFGSEPAALDMSVGAINDKGQIAGVASYHGEGNVWDLDRGVLYFSSNLSEVHAINNNGVVVGWDQWLKAFVWQRSLGKRCLPLLKPHDRHTAPPTTSTTPAGSSASAIRCRRCGCRTRTASTWWPTSTI